MIRARRIVAVATAAAVTLGLGPSLSAAGPPESAELFEIPATWSSPTVPEGDSAGSSVISFGKQAWVAGAVAAPPVEWRRTQSLFVQHCTKAAGCTSTELAAPPNDDPGEYSRIETIAGPSPEDLWVGGWSWQGPDEYSEHPQIWRNASGSWEPFPTTGITGSAQVVDFTFGPGGQVWAMVIEDFDGGTWVVYELEGTRWSQISPIEDTTLPGACGEDWYSTWWVDMVVVGGRPALVGSCGQPVIVKQRPNGTWRRIDAGLPTTDVLGWENAAVVDNQLWVQGIRSRFDPMIYRRVKGAWRPVSTEGIAGYFGELEMSGTVGRNLWLAGTLQATPGDGPLSAAAWRWTGTRWRQVDPPDVSATPSSWEDVSARGYKPAWLAGWGPERNVVGPSAQRALVARAK